MTDAGRSHLARQLDAVGVEASTAALEALERWLDLHEKWSRRFNLTGTRDRTELIERHLVDCAAIVPRLPPGRLVDVGSGAGLPGFVVGLLEPARGVVLLDAQERRTAFLHQAVLELGAGNVSVVTARAESWSPPDDTSAVLARAVAPLARLVALCAPLLTPDRSLLAMKGPGWRNEVADLPPGYRLKDAYEYRLPGRDRIHVLLEVEQGGAG